MTLPTYQPPPPPAPPAPKKEMGLFGKLFWAIYLALLAVTLTLWIIAGAILESALS